MHLNIVPAELLGQETWNALLQTAEVYSKELEECETEREKVGWPTDGTRALSEHIRCLACDSELMKPVNPTEPSLPSVKFRCSSCGQVNVFEELAEAAVDGCHGAEAHIAIKDGGESPYEDCPECGKATYLTEDDLCAACGYSREYTECAVCRTVLSADEQELEGLCGYHHWVAMKERDR